MNAETCDFSSELSKHRPHHIERVEIMQTLRSFAAENDRGYVHIKAEAGLGKTALAAHLIDHFDAPGYFFSEAESRKTPRDCWTHLAAQLNVQYVLGLTAVPQRAADGNPSFFTEALTKACEGAVEPIWIVIDALDEADTTERGSNPINLPKTLPKGAYIVLTSRPSVTDPYVGTTPLKELTIRSKDAEQARLIRDYVNYMAQQPEIASRLTEIEPNIEPEAFVEQLIAASENNFMYLTYVEQDFCSAAPDAFAQVLRAGAANLPTGLQGYYNRFWEHWKDNPDDHQRLLGLLAASQEPSSADWLAAHSGLSRGKVNQTLASWRRFLVEKRDGPNRTWHFVHQSFADYLRTKDELDVAQTHCDVAERYLGDWGGLAAGLPSLKTTDWKTSLNRYGLKHTVAHLIKSGRLDDVYTLLTLEGQGQELLGDKTFSPWQRAHDQAGLSDRYISNIQLAWAAQAGANTLDIAQNGSSPNVAREVFYALLVASIQTATSRVPAALLRHLLDQELITPQEALSQAVTDEHGGDGWYELFEVAEGGNEAFLGLMLERIEQNMNRYSGVLPALAQKLPQALLPRATELAARIANPLVRGAAYISLRQNPAVQNAVQLVKSALQVYEAETQLPARIELLSLLKPHISADDVHSRSIALFPEVLNLEHHELIGCLTPLIPLLPKALKPSALEKILEAARTEKQRADAITDQYMNDDSVVRADSIRDSGYFHPLCWLMSEFVVHAPNLILEEMENSPFPRYFAEAIEAFDYPEQRRLLLAALDHESDTERIAHFSASRWPELRAEGYEKAQSASDAEQLVYVFNLRQATQDEIRQALKLIQKAEPLLSRCKAQLRLLELANEADRQTISDTLLVNLKQLEPGWEATDIYQKALPYAQKIPKLEFLVKLRSAQSGDRNQLYEELVSIAPYLGGKLEEPELEEVLAFDKSMPSNWTHLSEIFAPQLSEERFKTLLQEAPEKQDSPSSTFDAILRLVEARKRPLEPQVQLFAMAAAVASDNDVTSRAVTQLLNALEGPTAPETLRMAYEGLQVIDDRTEVDKTLVAFAPFASEDMRTILADKIRESGNYFQLAKIATYCNEDKKAEFFREAISKGAFTPYRAYNDPERESELFTNLSPTLLKTLQPFVAEKLRSFDGGSWEALAISYVQNLPEMVDATTLELAETTQDIHLRAKLYAELLPKLDSATKWNLVTQLARSDELRFDISYDCRLLPQLLKAAQDATRKDILEFVVEVVRANAPDDPSGYQAMRIVHALVEMVGAVPNTDSAAVQVAESIVNDPERLQALTEIYLRSDLAEAKRQFSKMLAAYDDLWKIEVWVRDNAHTFGSDFADFVLHELETKSTDSSIFAQALLELAKVTEVPGETIHTAIQNFSDASMFFEGATVLNGELALTALSKGLELSREQLERDGVDSHYRDEERSSLTSVLTNAIPNLSDAALGFLVDSVIQGIPLYVPDIVSAMAPKLKREDLVKLFEWTKREFPAQWRSWTIYTLSPYLWTENLLTETDMLDAFELALCDEWLQSGVDEKLNIPLDYPKRVVYQLWSRIVQNSATKVQGNSGFQTRKALLSTLGASASLLAKLGGQTTADESADALLRVQRWWTPLKKTEN